MGVRSKYREKFLAEKVAEEIPPSAKINIDDPAPDDAIKAAGPPVTDEATLRLQKQIDDLKKSEELQRQHAAQMAEMQRQQQWLPGEQEFMAAYPELSQHPDLTQQAVIAAYRQGHQRGTEPFLKAVKHNFDSQMDRLNPRLDDSAVEHAPQDDYRPTPSMQPPSSFRPLPESADEDRRSAFVSAPVSRETPSAGGSRSNRQIRLTAEEREHARMAGVSEVEYAKQKQKLIEAKNEGSYGDHRYR
jgi:hypothetical protein